MEEIQSLRKLSLRLETSGTAVPISSTKLYRGSFGFVGLQVYVPVMPIRAAGSKPICTVHRTVIDNFGNRKQFANDKYNLVYVDNVMLSGAQYMLFENPMPAAFTDTEGALELVINYSEIRDGNVVSRLATNIYRTKVEEGGAGEGETATDLKGQEAAQINANTIAIESLVDGVENLLRPPDCSDANTVGMPSVTITEDGNLKFSCLKGETGKTGALGPVPDISIAAVSLPPGSIPMVSKSGTNDSPHFTMGIPEGKKGERGEPFAVKKVYISVEDMLKNFTADLIEGEFAIIETGNVENAENARLYVRGGLEMRYITDLSGARGIKGETGEIGQTGATGPQGANAIIMWGRNARGKVSTVKWRRI